MVTQKCFQTSVFQESISCCYNCQKKQQKDFVTVKRESKKRSLMPAHNTSLTNKSGLEQNSDKVKNLLGLDINGYRSKSY